ncbi:MULTISPECIES: SMI1/KNR4 family protein [Deinococcus]|uniref:SMI1/KNR4 family protein n=1 Tax=Deinococcus xianganensis TaxID=1507289 RepID=A0A6I4YSY9_9DEIO|nr:MULTISPECIES: SMI1/KNR4 family protein [Deinococcus]MXV20193.1 SMI1/KNR4 family protein [Deinococcus xianganensis]RIY04512.1 SMI1/KNR4 family protein [Deinococcus sp. RM]
MSGSIDKIFDQLRRSPPTHGGTLPDATPLRHTISQPLATEELGLLSSLPQGLIDFWAVTASARLFEDTVYGQWGLQLYEPTEASAATACFQRLYPEHFRHGDLILGSFLGDCDQLLIRTDQSQMDWGEVWIHSPLDERAQWERVADDLPDFLQRYVRVAGQKFWEPHGKSQQ